MTPEQRIAEVARSLAADPTLSLMSASELEEEITALLITHGAAPEDLEDGLAVALVGEEAKRIAAAPQEGPGATAPPGFTGERCRLETPCSRPQVAANGRCLDCGAYLTAATVLTIEGLDDLKALDPEAPVNVTVEVVAIKEPKYDPLEEARARVRGDHIDMTPAPEPEPPPIINPDDEEPDMPRPGPPLFYRLKLATNLADHQLAEVLGVKRSTVQAYVAGRLPHVLKRGRAKAIREMLIGQRDAIDALIKEVKAT